MSLVISLIAFFHEVRIYQQIDQCALPKVSGIPLFQNKSCKTWIKRVMSIKVLNECAQEPTFGEIWNKSSTENSGKESSNWKNLVQLSSPKGSSWELEWVHIDSCSQFVQGHKDRSISKHLGKASRLETGISRAGTLGPGFFHNTVRKSQVLWFQVKGKDGNHHYLAV